MNELDFRKYLTTYGINYEEYQGMTEEKKKELIDRFNKETQQQKVQSKSDGIKSAGEAVKSIGCLIMLVPIVLVLLSFIWAVITGWLKEVNRLKKQLDAQ